MECKGITSETLNVCSLISWNSINCDLGSPTLSASERNAKIIPSNIPRAARVVNQNFPLLHLWTHLSGWPWFLSSVWLSYFIGLTPSQKNKQYPGMLFLWQHAQHPCFFFLLSLFTYFILAFWLSAAMGFALLPPPYEFSISVFSPLP